MSDDQKQPSEVFYFVLFYSILLSFLLISLNFYFAICCSYKQTAYLGPYQTSMMKVLSGKRLNGFQSSTTLGIGFIKDACQCLKYVSVHLTNTKIQRPATLLKMDFSADILLTVNLKRKSLMRSLHGGLFLVT